MLFSKIHPVRVHFGCPWERDDDAAADGGDDAAAAAAAVGVANYPFVVAVVAVADRILPFAVGSHPRGVAKHRIPTFLVACC